MNRRSGGRQALATSRRIDLLLAGAGEHPAAAALSAAAAAAATVQRKLKRATGGRDRTAVVVA